MGLGPKPIEANGGLVEIREQWQLNARDLTVIQYVWSTQGQQPDNRAMTRPYTQA